MIPDAKFLEIATGLMRKTKAEQAAWKQVVANESAYMLQLPKSMIELAYNSPPTEPDFISLSLFHKDGKKVGQWNVHEGDDSWELLFELFSLVNRKVTGWDTVLQDVEGFLSGRN